MELDEALRTTFAAREFTGEELPDQTLFAILDRARFAPSASNRQPWKVVIVRDHRTRKEIAACEDAAAAAAGIAMPNWTSPVLTASVVLVACLDLSKVIAIDANVGRTSVSLGSSIYPFAWSILLAAREEGFGGTLTTLATGQEPRLREALGIPDGIAVGAVLPLGRPARQVRQLKRRPVAAFTMRERWNGAPLEG